MAPIGIKQVIAAAGLQPVKAGKIVKQTAKEVVPDIKKVGNIAHGYTTPSPRIEPVSPKFYDEIRECGIDGAYEPSVYDTLRAHMYPQIFETYEVGAGIVKGKVTKIFDSLKHLNEQFSKPGKEIRLAPVGETSVRGRNIVTLTRGALQDVKSKGIERIVDLRAEVNSSLNGRLTMKDGKKYVDGVEYIHVPVSYNNGLEDLETIKKLPEFFDTMNKGHVYIGCNMGSHRTDFAVALNYALNTAAKEAPPVLYLPPKEVTKGIQRIYNKLKKMSPEELKTLGLTDEFINKLPKDKEALNSRLLQISNASKGGN